MKTKRESIDKWSIEKCQQFMADWSDNEQIMAEQAALAVTCEQYGISYMDAEWVEVVERIPESQP